jgi:hypothetical protein
MTLIAPGTRLMLLTAVIIAHTGIVPAAEAEDSAESMQMAAYLQMLRADEAMENGDGAAAESYREAQARYQALREAFPDWKSEMIAYRIQYCSDALESAAQVPPTAAAGLPPTDPSPAGGPPDESLPVGIESQSLPDQTIQALQKENNYLQLRLMELEDEITGAQEVPATHSEEISRLRLENAEYEAATKSLQLKLDDSRIERSTHRGLEQENAELRARLEQYGLRTKGHVEESRQQARIALELRQQLASLKSRNRQMQLALKGADLEADVIQAMEEEQRELSTKVRMLLDQRNGAIADGRTHATEARAEREKVEAMKAQLEEAQRALATSLAETQTLIAENARLAAEGEASTSMADRVRNEADAALAAAHDDASAQRQTQEAEFAALEEELEESRDWRVALEARMAATQREAVEAAERADLADAGREGLQQLLDTAQLEREKIAAALLESNLRIDLLEADLVSAQEAVTEAWAARDAVAPQAAVLESGLEDAKPSIAEAERMIGGLRASLETSDVPGLVDTAQWEALLQERDAQLDSIRRNMAELSNALSVAMKDRDAALGEEARLQSELDTLRIMLEPAKR